MPDRLSVPFTLLLVALVFCLTIAIETLLSAGSSSAKPTTRDSAPASPASTPRSEPDLALRAAVRLPALRDPRKPARKKRPKRTRKKRVTQVRAPAPAASFPPAVSVRPTPTATPRYVPPAPRYVPPAPTYVAPAPRAPRPTPTAPTPTAAPPSSGEFDTTGEP